MYVDIKKQYGAKYGLVFLKKKIPILHHTYFLLKWASCTGSQITLLHTIENYIHNHNIYIYIEHTIK